MKYEIDFDETGNLKNNTNVNHNPNNRDSSLNRKIIYKKDLKTISLIKYLPLTIIGLTIIFLLYSKIKTTKETKKVERILTYYNDCKSGKLYEEIKIEPKFSPLISIIIPTYNKKDEILPLLRSIQNQSFKKFEIIFVDDNSKDGTDKIIKKQIMYDSRITIRKHDTNKGTLISRNDGAKIARGKYILFIDPDDMLLEGILDKVYKIAENNKTDIVEFQAIRLNSLGEFCSYYPPFKKTTNVTQPELSYIMYNYNNHRLVIQSIWGKLIKKSVFIKTIESISDYFLEQYMCLNEGLLMSFALFQNANSYIYYDGYGYLYLYNDMSMSINKRKVENANKSVKSLFLYIEFINEYTGNDVKKKKMGIYHLERMNINYPITLTKVTEGFDYIWKILNSYKDSKYIEDEDKKIINVIAAKIEEAQKNAK